MPLVHNKRGIWQTEWDRTYGQQKYCDCNENHPNNTNKLHGHRRHADATIVRRCGRRTSWMSQHAVCVCMSTRFSCPIELSNFFIASLDCLNVTNLPRSDFGSKSNWFDCYANMQTQRIALTWNGKYKRNYDIYYNIMALRSSYYLIHRYALRSK